MPRRAINSLKKDPTRGRFFIAYSREGSTRAICGPPSFLVYICGCYREHFRAQGRSVTLLNGKPWHDKKHKNTTFHGVEEAISHHLKKNNPNPSIDIHCKVCGNDLHFTLEDYRHLASMNWSDEYSIPAYPILRFGSGKIKSLMR